jgi:hypothetical protein
MVVRLKHVATPINVFLPEDGRTTETCSYIATLINVFLSEDSRTTETCSYTDKVFLPEDGRTTETEIPWPESASELY